MNNAEENRSYEELDDHALMELCKIGDEGAFRAIYDRHAESLMGFLVKFCGDRHLAADVVQETFEYLFRKIDEYEPNAPLHSLLYKVARNTCLKKLRKKRKETNMDVQWDDLEGNDEDPTPDEQVREQEQVERIREIIGTLPDPFREVLILRVIDGLKYREISEIVDVPLGTVKSRLHSGLDRLREKLSEQMNLNLSGNTS